MSENTELLFRLNEWLGVSTCLDDCILSRDITHAITTIEQLQSRVNELQDFCIWLTGCGYDFCQHDYFIQQRDKLLKDYKAGPFTQPPEISNETT